MRKTCFAREQLFTNVKYVNGKYKRHTGIGKLKFSLKVQIKCGIKKFRTRILLSIRPNLSHILKN